MFAFLASILSSDSDQGSFSRASGAVIILALIVWASWIAYNDKLITDIPVNWLYLVLGLYGINKLVEGAKIIVPALKSTGSTPSTPSTEGA